MGHSELVLHGGLDGAQLHIWNPFQGDSGQPLADTPDEICDQLRQLYRRRPLDLVLVDSLSLTTYHEKSDGQAVHEFSNLARELDIPVLLAAHLRFDTGNDTGLPAVRDFDDPHVLQAADAVILLHNPNRYGNAPERVGLVDPHAAQGWKSKGTATVRFEPEYHRFVDLPNA